MLNLHRSVAAIFLALVLGPSLPLHADAPEGPREVTQRFYNQYVKVKETVGWVAHSNAVTPGFKKAFLAVMKNPDTESDPIVVGQDVPKSGFNASKASVKGTTALVLMTSKDPGFPQTIHVHLIFDGKAWLINGVDNLHGK